MLPAHEAVTEYEIRTCHPSSRTLDLAYYRDIPIALGARLNIVRYVNETWTEPVEFLSAVRSEKQLSVLSQVATGNVAEEGYVIDPTKPIPLRYNGWFVRSPVIEPEACRVEDIAVVCVDMAFQNHHEIRTTEPLDTVRAPEGARPGDCLRVTRYVNDDYRDIVSVLAGLRIGKDGLFETEPLQHTGNAPEVGFVLTRIGNRVTVRFNGRTADHFDTMVEAKEYVARNGYGVREDRAAMVLHRFGKDLEYFPSAKAAWDRLKELQLIPPSGG